MKYYKKYYRRIVGIPSIDFVVSPTPSKGWIIELYGSAAMLLAHHAIAEAAGRGLVAVVHVQDFGGFDPYLVRRLARARGVSVDNVLIARAFRLQDVAPLVEEASRTGARTVVVIDPYHYTPRSPRDYWRLTPITAALRNAARRALVVVANRVGKYGRLLPEGGNFHHHSVHVIVRAWETGRGVMLELVKHPYKPAPRRALATWAEVGVAWRWAGRRSLLEYL
ncbi:MAG: DNA recombination/repair protein RecA [Desulfurococcales archaeon]|nr:DNA recombination/repair protein RecA [Desulfurococcales archaeon]